MSDGPLIVQSDKTLLLEVDHPLAARVPRGDRAVRRAGALARARAHLPGDAAGAVERPRRRARRRAGRRRAGALLPLPGAARAAGRRRRHDGPLRPAAAGQQPGARAGAAPRSTARCWRRSSASKKVAPMLGARIDADTVVVHPSERGRLKQALLKVGWPAEDLAGYVDGEAHPIELRPGRAGTCATTSRRPSRASGPAAPASSCCPAAPARRWSARPRWPRRRRPR